MINRWTNQAIILSITAAVFLLSSFSEAAEIKLVTAKEFLKAPAHAQQAYLRTLQMIVRHGAMGQGNDLRAQLPDISIGLFSSAEAQNAQSFRAALMLAKATTCDAENSCIIAGFSCMQKGNCGIPADRDCSTAKEYGVKCEKMLFGVEANGNQICVRKSKTAKHFNEASEACLKASDKVNGLANLNISKDDEASVESYLNNFESKVNEACTVGAKNKYTKPAWATKVNCEVTWPELLKRARKALIDAKEKNSVSDAEAVPASVDMPNRPECSYKGMVSNRAGNTGSDGLTDADSKLTNSTNCRICGLQFVCGKLVGHNFTKKGFSMEQACNKANGSLMGQFARIKASDSCSQEAKDFAAKWEEVYKNRKGKKWNYREIGHEANALAQAGCYMYSKKEPVYLNGQWKSDEGKKYLSPVAVIPDLETMKKTNTGVTDKESYRSEVMSMLRISETDGVEAMQYANFIQDLGGGCASSEGYTAPAADGAKVD